MLTFEILCATMHQNDFAKVKEMNIKSDVVFANQCDRTSYEETKFDGHTAKMISTQTRGVGKNRNLALIYASADICLFADDDVCYSNDAEEKILSEFAENPKADIIIFHFESDHPTRKPPKYSKTKRWRSFRNPWGAVRIAFRLDSVKKANLWFTSLFGGGCLFPSGEDSIWLKSARKAGLRVYVSKETIGRVSYETSSWFTGYDEKYYYGIGACYDAINPQTSTLKGMLRAYRDKDKGQMTYKQKVQWIINGIKGYKMMMSFSDYKANYSDVHRNGARKL